MVRDAANLQRGETLEADVCIVGGGVAGMTIARGLIGTGRRVLLLEGGREDEETAENERLYAGETEGIPYDLTVTRTRAWGGSSRCWQGWCRPLSPEVFKQREWVADLGWPISYTDLLPYYRDAAETVEIGAFEWSAADVARRRDEELLDFDSERLQTVPYQFSPPTRFHREYGDELENATNVEPYVDANVVHIGLADDGERVDRLECRTLEGVDFAVEADEYVLATGGVENPRLMLAADDVRPDGVGNHSGHLGRHFMEHPHFDRTELVATRPDIDVSPYLRRFRATSVSDRHPGGKRVDLRLALSLTESRNRSRELLPLSAILTEIDTDGEDPAGAVASDVLSAALLDRDQYRLFRLSFRAAQRPIRENRVSLLDERDQLGLRRVKLKWRVPQKDFDDYHRSLQEIAGAFGRMGVGRMWSPLEDGAFRRPPRGGSHHMGTTRMSEAPSDGVVDPDCRVHGVDNLYVAGSSVFPTCGYANPTLTIVALAHRLAAHLEANG